jgi:hypothetical protein
MGMEATIHLPESLVGRLGDLAKEENISVDALVGRLVSEHLNRRKHPPAERKTVQFPLLSREEAPVILPLTGTEIDEIFASEDFRP